MEAFVPRATEGSCYLFVNVFLPLGCEQLQKWNWLRTEALSAEAAAAAGTSTSTSTRGSYPSCCAGGCHGTCSIFPPVNPRYVGREGKFSFALCSDSGVLVEESEWRRSMVASTSCSQLRHMYPWVVTQPPPWAACSNAWQAFQWRNVPQ